MQGTPFWHGIKKTGSGGTHPARALRIGSKSGKRETAWPPRTWMYRTTCAPRVELPQSSPGKYRLGKVLRQDVCAVFLLAYFKAVCK